MFALLKIIKKNHLKTHLIPYFLMVLVFWIVYGQECCEFESNSPSSSSSCNNKHDNKDLNRNVYVHKYLGKDGSFVSQWGKIIFTEILCIKHLQKKLKGQISS